MLINLLGYIKYQNTNIFIRLYKIPDTTTSHILLPLKKHKLKKLWKPNSRARLSWGAVKAPRRDLRGGSYPSDGPKLRYDN